ncbi:MAG: DUF58 domain-containing protein [Planctomycetaceae bacterium]|nr:DUF58 domain-containing protein [Planctomycetaceae bacterium]
MSSPPHPELANSKVPLAGFVPLLVAGVLVALYVLLPFLRDEWPDVFHPLYWMFVGGLVVFSAVVFLWPKLPERLRRLIPRVNRNRMLIPREGIGYLLIMVVLFVGSSLTRENRLMLVFAALAGPFVVNGWITYTMLQNVRVTRKTPLRAMVGELFSVEMDLENRSPLISVWMMAAMDEVAVGDQRARASVLFTRVPPRTVQVGHYQLRLGLRGRHQFGPVEVVSRFPLGLIERGCQFREFGETLVYPRIGRLSPRWKRRLLGASELVETPQPRRGVFDDEFHHLREYRPGDNPRAIHWRSSARRNVLIVREYQQNREHNLVVLLDLETSGRSTDSPHVEQALSVAATVCVEHRRECRGSALTVIAAGRETWRWEATVSSAGLESLFDKLAVIEPAQSNRFAGLWTETVSHLAPSTRYIVVSTRTPAEALPNPLLPGGLQWVKVDDASFAELLHFPDEGVRAPETTVSSVPVTFR